MVGQMEESSYNAALTLIVLSARYLGSSQCLLEAVMAEDAIVIRLDATVPDPSWHVRTVFNVDVGDHAIYDAIAEAIVTLLRSDR